MGEHPERTENSHGTPLVTPHFMRGRRYGSGNKARREHVAVPTMCHADRKDPDAMPTRRSRSFGSLRRLPSGKWRARYSTPDALHHVGDDSDDVDNLDIRGELPLASATFVQVQSGPRMSVKESPSSMCLLR